MSISTVKNTKIKEFFIFKREGHCLLHLDLQESKTYNKAMNLINDKKLENRYKLIYGLLFSMKIVIKNISADKENETFKSLSTNEYKIHYLEMMNGLRFVLLTEQVKTDYAQSLFTLFESVYINFITQNLLSEKECLYINNQVFLDLTREFLSGLS